MSHLGETIADLFDVQFFICFCFQKEIGLHKRKYI